MEGRGSLGATCFHSFRKEALAEGPAASTCGGVEERGGLSTRGALGLRGGSCLPGKESSGGGMKEEESEKEDY